MKQNTNEVRYVYVFPYWSWKDGITTVAYKFDDENKQIVYNFANCSPKDRFVKATGRDISSGRLLSNSKVHPNRTIPYSAVSVDGVNPRYQLITDEIHAHFMGP